MHPALETSLVLSVEDLVFSSDDGAYTVVRGRRESGASAAIAEQGKRPLDPDAVSEQEALAQSLVTVVGSLGPVHAGQRLRVTGRWREHPRFGPQFHAHTATELRPTHGEGVARFLGSGLIPGVGPSIAERIVAHFGDQTLDIISGQSMRLCEVEGIGKKRAEAIAQTLREKKAEAETLSYLYSLGIGSANAARIMDRYGDEAPQVVAQNPYMLAEEIRGIGFRTADAIGRMAGIEEDDPRRAAGAVVHVVAKAVDEGHVCLPEEALLEATAALQVSEGPSREAMRVLVERGSLKHEWGAYYAPPLHREECIVAERLAAFAKRPPKALAVAAVLEQLANDFPSLHPLQQKAVEQSVRSSLLVVTGGPGTGKTTTMKAVVAASRLLGKRLCLCAPTGRAAKRLSEASMHPAATIHRLLEWNPSTRRFSRNADHPLEANVVLVDEASMLDVRLASKLLEAIPPEAQLIFVGDVDQLPPVGPGHVLRSLIESKVAKVVRLTEVFRQAQKSAIVRAAHAILRGEKPEASQAFPRGEGELFIVPLEDRDDVARRLLSVIERLGKAYALDPSKDVQVLTPMRKGPIGTEALNLTLRDALNPQRLPALASALDDDAATHPSQVSSGSDVPPKSSKAPKRSLVFGPGDKVMQLRNDYDREVFNGDLGTVSQQLGGTWFVDIDGREVRYSAQQLESLTLAYASTIHKVQGSEFPGVVMVLHRSHHILLSRALFYTGLTRAKQVVVLLCDAAGMRRALENLSDTKTHSFLRERIVQQSTHQAAE